MTLHETITEAQPVQSGPVLEEALRATPDLAARPLTISELYGILAEADDDLGAATTALERAKAGGRCTPGTGPDLGVLQRRLDAASDREATARTLLVAARTSSLSDFALKARAAAGQLAAVDPDVEDLAPAERMVASILRDLLQIGEQQPTGDPEISISAAVTATTLSEIGQVCEQGSRQQDRINAPDRTEDWDDARLAVECAAVNLAIRRAIAEPSRSLADLSAKARLVLPDFESTMSNKCREHLLAAVILRELTAQGPATGDAPSVLATPKPTTTGKYDYLDLELDILDAAQYTRSINLTLRALCESGVEEGDIEAVFRISRLADAVTARVLRTCNDAPHDHDWFGLRPRGAGSQGKASA